MPAPIIIPVYTSHGDVGAYLVYPNLHNLQGEWIGWVTSQREVYSVHGQYVGYLTNEPRILRKAADAYDRPRRKPPEKPTTIRPPANAPLAPLMAELNYGTIDVLKDMPDLLPPIDFGDLREDLDY